MRWIWWVIGGIIVLGLYIMFYCIAASCEPTSPEEELKCLREQEKERRRKHDKA